MERFYYRYDKDIKTLTLEVTPALEQQAVGMFKEHLLIEMLSASIETADVVNGEGRMYRNVRRYAIQAEPEKVEVFFTAAKVVLARSISNSIGHCDN